jgi:hypothetical protein
MMVSLEYRTALGEQWDWDYDFVTFTVKDEREAFAYLKGFLVDVHIKSMKVM